MASLEERNEVLKLFQGLRVTDVCDGMDAAGLADIFCMDSEIKALWKDDENFEHRIYGIAHTVRILPARTRWGLNLNQEPDAAKFHEYERYGYGLTSTGKPVEQTPIQKGDVLVIDGEGCRNAGYVGSNNALGWVAQGAVGVVINFGCRDTDEVVKERIPVYCKYTVKGINPGRIEVDARQVPIECGGVQVHPGDVVVADGDGVIVVPWNVARFVAAEATMVAEGDKKGRARLYERTGRKPDWTLEPLKR